MCVCVCTHGVHARLCVYVYVIVAWPIGGIVNSKKLCFTNNMVYGNFWNCLVKEYVLFF